MTPDKPPAISQQSVYVCQSHPATIMLGANVCLQQASRGGVLCSNSPIMRYHV